MKLILASSNPNKAIELNSLLSASGLEISPAPKKIEVLEDGETFQENAYKKAFAYYKEFGAMSVADDSGLVIPARPDILGVQSARFAPELPDYKDKNAHLLEIIKGLDGEERGAYFACYLCFYLSEKEIYYFEGRVHGTIGVELRGTGGFGYDPIFHPDGQMGKSLSELSEWKMLNSHRAKASKAALNFFKGYKTGCQIQ